MKIERHTSDWLDTLALATRRGLLTAGMVALLAAVASIVAGAPGGTEAQEPPVSAALGGEAYDVLDARRARIYFAAEDALIAERVGLQTPAGMYTRLNRVPTSARASMFGVLNLRWPK